MSYRRPSSGKALNTHVIGHDQDDVRPVRRGNGKACDDWNKDPDEIHNHWEMI
jgi:hypothetical protein